MEELERAVVELGLRGLKLHPGRQELLPERPRFAPLFARARRSAFPSFSTPGMIGGRRGHARRRGLR